MAKQPKNMKKKDKTIESSAETSPKSEPLKIKYVKSLTDLTYDEVDPEALAEIERDTFAPKLDKATKAMASRLTKPELFLLVKNYYQNQEDRKRQKARFRQAIASGEVTEDSFVFQWLGRRSESQEKHTHRLLDAYVQAHPVGKRMMAVAGIGPVISAGLLTHFDITKAPTAGHFWSFAGLNPNAVWEKGQIRPWNADLKKLCLHPTSVITTRRGHIPIKKVRIGDEVLTHLGNWKRVTEVMSRKYNGELIGVRMYGGINRSCWMTPNHPTYALKPAIDYNRQYVGDKKIATEDEVAQMRVMREEGHTLVEIGDKYGYSASGVSMLVRGLRRTTQSSPEEIGWARADALISDWWGFSPRRPIDGKKLELTITCEGAIHNSGLVYAEGKHKSVKAPRAIPVIDNVSVTPSFARLVGMYLSEGHVTNKSLGFSFHIEETDYQEFVLNWIAKFGSLKPQIYRKDDQNSWQVIINNKPLAHTFCRIFGKNSYDVHLPKEWMSATRGVLRGLLRGWWEGDKGVTVSRRLAYQMYDISRMLGIHTSLRFDKGLDGRCAYRINILDERKFDEEIMAVVSDSDRIPVSLRRDDANGTWHSFKDTETVHYKGKVFNLEVEDDHSYVADGIAVHNCWLMGECFVKVCGNPSAVYAQLYLKRKEWEWKNNVAGLYADAAAEKLKRFRITDAESLAWMTGDYSGAVWQTFPVGGANRIIPGSLLPSPKTLTSPSVMMLTPMAIHERSKRWAVKMFLSHLHQIMYEENYHTPAPAPYMIAHHGHVHVVPPTW